MRRKRRTRTYGDVLTELHDTVSWGRTEIESQLHFQTIGDLSTISDRCASTCAAHGGLRLQIFWTARKPAGAPNAYNDHD
jgi:hypothetical protein